MPEAELTCEDVIPVVQAYAFGRLVETEKAAVRNHLARCANCRTIVSEIERDTAAPRRSGPTWSEFLDEPRNPTSALGRIPPTQRQRATSHALEE